MARPQQNEHPAYFSKYIGLVKGNNIEEAISNHSQDIANFYLTLPNEKADFAYADGKWTLQQVLQHVLDTERVFMYRALIVARKSKVVLSSFDENEFALQALNGINSFDALKQEFKIHRLASDLFVQSLSNNMLNTFGTANGNPITANAIAFMNIGHFLHHKNIIEERYL
jgi:uncharacterized damage-inducible protein DinB